MIQPYPKHIWRKLFHLASLAWERELTTALGELEQEFARWRRGECGAFELERSIHAFQQGPLRDLHKKYENTMRHVTVALALLAGTLSEEDVGPDVLDALSGVLEDLRRIRNMR